MATVFFVQDVIKNLAVMDSSIGDCVATDQLVLFVDVDVVIVAIVARAMFLGPTGIQILLALHVGLLVPVFRGFAFLDLFVFISLVPVLRNIDQAGINDLATLGNKACIPELLVKGIEEFVGQSESCQLFPEQLQGLGIRDCFFC